MTASPEAKLARLDLEFRNKDAPDFALGDRIVSMRRLHARVLAIKAAETYTETWASLVLGKHDRHAHNEEYIARLLVLVDQRPIPINPLQRSIGLQLGHLFRTLERAGVDFRAHTSTLRARIREDYYPWPLQVFVDAENHRMFCGDEVVDIPRDLEVFKKDTKRPMKRDDLELEEDENPHAQDAYDVEDEIMGLLPDVDVVPLPIHPRLRLPVMPPMYRPVFRRDL